MVGDQSGEHCSGEPDGVCDLAVEPRGAVGAGVANGPPGGADGEDERGGDDKGEAEPRSNRASG
jgi:hypothetical protein